MNDEETILPELRMTGLQDVWVWSWAWAAVDVNIAVVPAEEDMGFDRRVSG
jgi:hypothetical protein